MGLMFDAVHREADERDVEGDGSGNAVLLRLALTGQQHHMYPRDPDPDRTMADWVAVPKVEVERVQAKAVVAPPVK